MTVNRYTKLIKTLKESPTNSMGAVYSLNPQGFDLRKADPPKTFYPDVDGNFPSGIPGNDGDKKYVRPSGFWDGGTEWGQLEDSDLTQDFLLDDPTGKSTDGLIAEDGSVKTPLPPNSRHFILGPLVDGYVPNHGYDNYTNIGYLQKDTRQFVLLARIQGQFTADLHQTGARVWDGSSNQLTIINSNFTLEMAEWFRDQITDARITNNVPYFYSGGVPQQPLNILQCPNCPPDMFGGVSPGTSGLFGTGVPPSLGTQYNNPPGDSGNQEKAKIFNLTPDQVATLAILIGLGLSIAAIIAVLFPEPTSSAAGATYLAGKFRFGASLKRALGNIWKRKPKTQKKIEYPRQSAEDRALDALLKRLDQPPPGGKGSGLPKPGRGMADRVDMFNSYDHITDVKQKLIIETFNKALLNETAPTGSGPAGGTEVADAYVHVMTQEYDADQLQQASNDANDLAGNKGLTDQQKSDIDKKAEDKAKELNNVDYNKPESWSKEQIDNFYDMVFSTDPEWLDQNFAKYEDLIDAEAAEKAYDDYSTQKEYLSSEEYYRTFEGYAENKDAADSMWPYVSQLEFKWSHDETGSSHRAYYKGVEVDTYEDGFGALRDWATAHQAHYDVFNNTILPAKKTALDLAYETLSSASDKAYSEFNKAMIEAWSQRNVNNDPFSLEGLTPTSIASMSEAEKRKLLRKLMAQGLINPDGTLKADRERRGPFAPGLSDDVKSDLIRALEKMTKDAGPMAPMPIVPWDPSDNKKYNMPMPPLDGTPSDPRKTTLATDARNPMGTGDQAMAPAALLANPMVQAAAAQGLAALAAFVGSMGLAKQIMNQINKTSDPYGQDQAGPTTTGKPVSGAVDLTPEQQAAVEAAGKELRDAEREYGEIRSNPDATDIQKDMARERVDRARKNRQRLRRKHREENKNRKESYIPKFLDKRDRLLTESKNPNQRKILREIRKPVTIKEAPTKYKINFSNQNTSSSQTDELVMKANARGQAWRSENKRWSGYETTEKDNIIQDRVGHGKQAFDYMIEHGTQKSEWRSKEVQEELNKIAHEKAMLNENPDFKSPFGNVEVSTTEKNDDNFNKVSKKIKQIASKDKEVKPEYPDDDQQQKNNMLSNFDKLKKEFEHEKLNTGERASAYYKRLDPTTAKSMPDAAYPQIDAFRDQAKKKPK